MGFSEYGGPVRITSYPWGIRVEEYRPEQTAEAKVTPGDADQAPTGGRDHADGPFDVISRITLRDDSVHEDDGAPSGYELWLSDSTSRPHHPYGAPDLDVVVPSLPFGYRPCTCKTSDDGAYNSACCPPECGR